MAILKWQDPLLNWSNPVLWQEEDWMPTSKDMNVYETDDNVVVSANVPGVDAENVDISIDSGTLSIKAEQEEMDEKDKGKKVYRQARKARYFYTTSLPCPVKADKVKAATKNGVVTVTLPKAEEAKPRKIKVMQE